ncbi:LysE family translocator [Thalassobaculum sp.]|uniref:LysE family translocator n=1 Tax=Thalassobaculum sp. TaxID=2022740 RepID=UPI0032EF2594
MLENTVALLTVALPLMGSPGPAIVSLAATGSTFGFRRGLPYLAGILLGNSTVLLMVATGITGMVLALPAAVPVLTTVGLAYLLYLAWKIATAPVVRTAAEPGREPTTAGGYLLSLVNPKAYAAIGAVYASGSIVPGDPVLDTALKIAVLIGVNVTVNTAWLGIGSGFSSVLRNPRTGRAMNWSLAGLLLASVGYTVLR